MKRSLLALLLLPACFADRTPPEGLPCAVEADCPETFTCRAALGTCVAVAGLDSTPPALSDIVITPAVATSLDEIRVSFASEPLLEPPVLTTDTSALSFTLVGSEGDSWRYAAVVADDATASGAHEISGDLVDASGNGAHVAVGTVTLDFDAPLASDCSFDPSSISLSDPLDGFVDVTLSFLEADLTIIDLELVGAADAYFLDYDVSVFKGETVLSATYEKTGAEAPGSYEVAYVVEDAVGNVANTFGCALEITP